MKEIEIWYIVKELSEKHKLNFYDTYVFVLDYIKRLEKLLNRRLRSTETIKTINQTVSYLISVNLFKL